MRVVKDRRTRNGWKLRVYMDAIKDVENQSNEQWTNQWLKFCTSECQFIPRETWLSILKVWALKEADALLKNQAA